jgi:hypothetical protein
LPRGAIVAFLPDFDSGEYADTDSLRRWLGERGFALCDGADGTPDLNHRMLLGTIHPEEAGSNIGSRTHDHRLREETGHAQGREQSLPTGRGPLVRVPDTGHRHCLEGTTQPAEHLPLSLRVLFIMKVR